MLTHLFDERRTGFLPFLKYEPNLAPEALDQASPAFFTVAVAGYMFLRPANDLTREEVYRFTHPPLAARLNFLMRDVAAWCSHNRPTLEDWIATSFNALMNSTVEAVRGASDYRQVWANQISFLGSHEGRRYTAALTDGITAYRKSWGIDKEEAQIT